MSRNQGPTFDLPKKLEKVLASLATYYGQHAKRVLQRVVVNSRYHIHEGWSYDNWNGGIYGHAVYFQVPAAIYYEVFDNLDAVRNEICKDINRIVNIQNEFVEEVFLELQDDPSLANWREQSGSLLHPTPAAMIGSQEQLLRLWKTGYLRLFLSHKAHYKKQASELKDAMDYYGVSCFVAHEDIEPTKEWQNEIEKALFSMDALVALMTEDFADSRWTDQEVGVAIGRQVPVVPIRLGTDPYGFIGKYQAISGTVKSAKNLAKEVYDALWTKPVLTARLTESLVARFETAEDYYHANALMGILEERIANASPDLIERLERAPKGNSQVSGAFEVQARLPKLIHLLRGTCT